MGVALYQVDSFTDEVFRGNPAAVCILPGPRPARWMQAVAREMNLSETAFVHREGAGHRLRWFTPTHEVALCGHATLAAAHVLWEAGHLAADEAARFASKSGALAATRRGDWIELDFPAAPARRAPVPGTIAAALGAPGAYAGLNALGDHVFELGSDRAVRELAPDIDALRRAEGRGVIVTSRSATRGVDYVCRYFAPALGIDEDPVTGSAQCALAPHWMRRLGRRGELVAHQVSARGGVLKVRAAGRRVKIAGQAVTVLEGRLRG